VIGVAAEPNTQGRVDTTRAQLVFARGLVADESVIELVAVELEHAQQLEAEAEVDGHEVRGVDTTLDEWSDEQGICSRDLVTVDAGADASVAKARPCAELPDVTAHGERRLAADVPVAEARIGAVGRGVATKHSDPQPLDGRDLERHLVAVHEVDVVGIAAIGLEHVEVPALERVDEEAVLDAAAPGELPLVAPVCALAGLLLAVFALGI